MIVDADPNNPTRPNLPAGTDFYVLAVLDDGTFDLFMPEPDPVEALQAQVAELTAALQALLGETP